MAVREQDELIGLVVDGYELQRPLGAGGMGVVYEARHRVLGRRAAVKVFRGAAERDVEASKRFRVEAQAVNAIRHPGLVDVFGFGTLPNGDLYLVMEYLEGRTFEALVAERAPLPVLEALALTAEVLDAVEAAHTRGVVHRDLKPANVFLVEPPGARPYVKVLDFGIAKVLDPRGFVSVHTRTASVMGTPLYMSPEQARAEAASPASDLYSVGLILFELLTGRRAFEAPNPARVMWMHVHEPPPFTADTNPRVPAEVDDLLQWLLAKRPSSRPPSAGFVAERLRALGAGLAEGEDARGQAQVSGASPQGLATPALPEPSPEVGLAPTVPSSQRPRMAATPYEVGAPFGPAALEAARRRAREARHRASGASGEGEGAVGASASGELRPGRAVPKPYRSPVVLAMIAGAVVGLVAATAAVIFGAARREAAASERPRRGAEAPRRQLSEDDVRRRLLDAAAQVLKAPSGGPVGRPGAQPPATPGDAGAAGSAGAGGGAEVDVCLDIGGRSDGVVDLTGVVPLTGVVVAPGGVSGVRLRVSGVACGMIPVSPGALPVTRGGCRGRRGTRFATALDLSGLVGGLRLVVEATSTDGGALISKSVALELSSWVGPVVAREPPSLKGALFVPGPHRFTIAGADFGGRRVSFLFGFSREPRDLPALSETWDRLNSEQMVITSGAATETSLARVCERLHATERSVTERLAGERLSKKPVGIVLDAEALRASASSPLVVAGTTVLEGHVVASSPTLALVLALGRWGADAGVETEPLVMQVPVSLRAADGGAPFVFDFAAPLDFEDVPTAGGEVWLLAMGEGGSMAEARVPVRGTGWPELDGRELAPNVGHASLELDGESAFRLRDVRVRGKPYDVRLVWSPALRRFVMTEVLPTDARSGSATARSDAGAPAESGSIDRDVGRWAARARPYDGAFALYGSGEDAGLDRTLLWARGRRVAALPGPMRSVALANLDGDGRVDLAGVALDGGVVVSLDRRRWTPVESPDARGARQVVAADFDGDGFDELACVAAGGQVRVTKDRSHWVTVGDGPAISLLAADFDPDGRDELVELHESWVARVLFDVPLRPSSGRPHAWTPLKENVRELILVELEAGVAGPELVLRHFSHEVTSNADAIATLRPAVGRRFLKWDLLQGVRAQQVLVAHPDGSAQATVFAHGVDGRVYVTGPRRRELRPLDVALPARFTHFAAADLDGQGRSALLGFGDDGGVWVSQGLGEFRFDRELSAAVCPRGRGHCRGVRVAAR